MQQDATPQVSHHHAHVDDVKVFYRQAGNPAAPTVLLVALEGLSVT